VAEALAADAEAASEEVVEAASVVDAEAALAADAEAESQRVALGKAVVALEEAVAAAEAALEEVVAEALEEVVADKRGSRDSPPWTGLLSSAVSCACLLPFAFCFAVACLFASSSEYDAVLLAEGGAGLSSLRWIRLVMIRYDCVDPWPRSAARRLCVSLSLLPFFFSFSFALSNPAVSILSVFSVTHKLPWLCQLTKDTQLINARITVSLCDSAVTFKTCSAFLYRIKGGEKKRRVALLC
jgi:hypothetical protein